MYILCGGDAYSTATNVKEREAKCPVNIRAGTPKRYLNYGGTYTAFSVDCRVVKEQKQRARERYLDRPITFTPPPVRIQTVGNVTDPTNSITK